MEKRCSVSRTLLQLLGQNEIGCWGKLFLAPATRRKLHARSYLMQKTCSFKSPALSGCFFPTGILLLQGFPLYFRARGQVGCCPTHKQASPSVSIVFDAHSVFAVQLIEIAPDSVPVGSLHQAYDRVGIFVETPCIAVSVVTLQYVPRVATFGHAASK